MILDELQKYKPASIHDVIPSEFFTKYDSYEYVWCGNYYEWYYALSKLLQPKSFMEIGVRFGFSFLPSMIGSDLLEYALGWDLETYGNNTIARENIQSYYHGPAKWEIEHIDSQIQSQLPRFFDLVSIDGCHEYDGKIHDLKMAMKQSSYVIVDDYDYIPHVRQAIDFFLKEYRDYIEWNEYVPTFRGTQIIKFKQ